MFNSILQQAISGSLPAGAGSGGFWRAAAAALQGKMILAEARYITV
ncbi:hypothetical protein [Intestinirhabdus alba]|nr:hypothetical protein [Intestinirhabdus alba]